MISACYCVSGRAGHSRRGSAGVLLRWARLRDAEHAGRGGGGGGRGRGGGLRDVRPALVGPPEVSADPLPAHRRRHPGARGRVGPTRRLRGGPAPARPGVVTAMTVIRVGVAFALRGSVRVRSGPRLPPGQPEAMFLRSSRSPGLTRRP